MLPFPNQHLLLLVYCIKFTFLQIWINSCYYLTWQWCDQLALLTRLTSQTMSNEQTMRHAQIHLRRDTQINKVTLKKVISNLPGPLQDITWSLRQNFLRNPDITLPFLECLLRAPNSAADRSGLYVSFTNHRGFFTCPNKGILMVFQDLFIIIIFYSFGIFPWPTDSPKLLFHTFYYG